MVISQLALTVLLQQGTPSPAIACREWPAIPATFSTVLSSARDSLVHAVQGSYTFVRVTSSPPPQRAWLATAHLVIDAPAWPYPGRLLIDTGRVWVLGPQSVDTGVRTPPSALSLAVMWTKELLRVWLEDSAYAGSDAGRYYSVNYIGPNGDLAGSWVDTSELLRTAVPFGALIQPTEGYFCLIRAAPTVHGPPR